MLFKAEISAFAKRLQTELTEVLKLLILTAPLLLLGEHFGGPLGSCCKLKIITANKKSCCNSKNVTVHNVAENQKLMTGNNARARMGGGGLSTIMNESRTLRHRGHFSVPCKFSTNTWVQGEPLGV